MIALRPLPPALFLALALLAGTAEARPARDAQLRACGAEACVVIEGRRGDPRAAVRVADHPVAVHGGRRFRIALPLATVRDWSAPFARTIALRIDEPGGPPAERSVRLPIGLLGHVTELAALEVSAR